MHGVFDTDLHEVNSHFALGLTASWVQSSTDRVRISVKEPIQMACFFIPHLKKQIQPLNHLKTWRKVYIG